MTVTADPDIMLRMTLLIPAFFLFLLLPLTIVTTKLDCGGTETGRHGLAPVHYIRSLWIFSLHICVHIVPCAASIQRCSCSLLDHALDFQLAHLRGYHAFAASIQRWCGCHDAPAPHALVHYLRILW